MKKQHVYIIFCITLLAWGCKKNAPTPVVDLVDPAFGPVESLVIFEGQNLSNINSVTFSGVPVNFNTAYNSEIALLMRIPTNVPLGDHEVVLSTDGGDAVTQFKVTEKPPEIFSVEPESANVGDEITIRGENFFDPLEVLFFDSVSANIVSQSPTEIKVVVPEDAKKGFVIVKANGGRASSPKVFFTTKNILVNDFDGAGIRSETDKWIFVGSVNENPQNAVQNSNPDPLDGNFIKISGTDVNGISWIGGAENHSWDVEAFSTFGITSTLGNTLLEMDINNNGADNTHVLFVLLERDGSRNDFSHQVKIDGSGWQKLSIPLNRFTDFGGLSVDPQKVRTLKIHLIDADDSDQLLEVNVDNIQFVAIN